MPGRFTARELVGVALSIVFCISTSSIGLGQLTAPSTTKPPVEVLRAASQPTAATLIAHWPLLDDTQNKTNLNLSSAVQGVAFESVTSGRVTRRAARFNGRDSVLETTAVDSLQLRAEPFSISLWVNIAETLGDSVGDLISQFDYGSRTGFHLGVYSHGGVTNSQPNSRQLHFGIDSGRIDPAFKDHGRLGDAVYVFAMCVHRGRLYASTCTTWTEVYRMSAFIAVFCRTSR